MVVVVGAVLVTRVVGAEVNVVSELVEVELVRVLGEEGATVVDVVVELVVTGGGDEVTVGAAATVAPLTVVGFTVTVPPPLLGAVLLNRVRSWVLLATDTVGDVVVWAVFSSAVTGEEVVLVEVERLFVVVPGRLVLVGASRVVPATGSEAVTVVIVATGNESGLAVTEFMI